MSNKLNGVITVKRHLGPEQAQPEEKQQVQGDRYGLTGIALQLTSRLGTAVKHIIILQVTAKTRGTELTACCERILETGP